MHSILRPATIEDATDIASRIREADRKEALAYAGVSPSILLPYAAKRGNAMVNIGERPDVILGVDPIKEVPGMGFIWLMATKELDTDPRKAIKFIRNSKPVLAHYSETYPILGNYVDERNKLHIRWLDWLGFKVIRRIPEWGAARVPFLQVIKIKE